MTCKHLDTLPCGDSQSMSRCHLHPEGTDGFCVNAKSVKDVHDAIDRMHTQILDRIEFLENMFESGSSQGADKTVKNLRRTLHTLESAMEELYCLI